MNTEWVLNVSVAILGQRIIYGNPPPPPVLTEEEDLEQALALAEEWVESIHYMLPIELNAFEVLDCILCVNNKAESNT